MAERLFCAGIAITSQLKHVTKRKVTFGYTFGTHSITLRSLDNNTFLHVQRPCLKDEVTGEQSEHTTMCTILCLLLLLLANEASLPARSF